MKGIVFNLLEEFVCQTAGDEAYEAILAACQLRTQEPFVGPGVYPDEDLMAIVGATVRHLGIAPADALRGFGKFMFSHLAARYPDFVSPYRHPKAFLQTVGPVIHLEVKKLHPDAELPGFAYEDPSPDRLLIAYASPRRLCYLMEGLLDGVGEYFGSPIKHTQTRCVHHDAPDCRFELVFTEALP